MVGWHHRLDGHEFEQALGDGQGSLACCSPWVCKELDTIEQLNPTELKGVSLLCLRQTPGSKPPAQDSAPFSAEQPGINMSTGSHTEAVPWSQCRYSRLCLPPGAVSPGRPKSGLSDLSSDNNRMTMGPFGPPPQSHAYLDWVS